MSEVTKTLAPTLPPEALEGVCQPIKTEFGAPPDLSLMTDPETKEFAQDIAQNLVDTHTYRAEEVKTGEAARRTAFALGCTACGIAEICIIKQDIDARIEDAELNGDFMEKAGMLASAPNWLNAARINLAGLTPEELAAKATDETALKHMDETGALDELLADTKNTFDDVYKKEDLSELTGVQCIDDDAELEAHTIETKNGDKFTVIDASVAVGFTGTPPDAASYGVLAGKMLNRMSNRDPRGNPQILTEDFKMQKTLASELPNAPISELRMNGKNRMYITVTPTEDGNRIIILGSHGGNSQTQNEFIAHVTA